MNTEPPNPLVSVIIPAFNAAAYLGETLSSVLGQTYQNVEIIVVDDGSSDGSLEIVKQMADMDPRVKWVQQKNAGVAAARNTAIRHASGSYIAPIDADDIWYPTKLEKQVQCMERAGSGVGLAYTWWRIIDEQGETLMVSYPWQVEGYVADSHLALNFIGNASVPIFRRAALDKVGMYDTSLRAEGGEGCEDWDLSLRIAEHFQLKVVPEYLVGYRRVRGSMSGKFESMIKSHELFLTRARARRGHIPPYLARWSRGLMYGYIVMIAVRTKDLTSALHWFTRAVFNRGVSFRSPWILELLAAKTPAPADRTLKSLIWRRYSPRQYAAVFNSASPSAKVEDRTAEEGSGRAPECPAPTEGC